MDEVDPEVERAAALLAHYMGGEQKFMVPKSEWGPGPWQDEPDSHTFNHLGYECWMIRVEYGSWCGYIEVPHTHRWAVPNYDDLNTMEGPDVHGGFTYAHDNGHAMHYGFDCGHASDWQPAMAAWLHRQTNKVKPAFPTPRFGEVYRNMKYVTNNLCEAAQWFKRRE